MTIEGNFPATGMPDADWWTALWPDPEAVLRALGIDRGQAVLDLCCGDGLFTVPLCHLVGAEGRVTALDLDADLLVAARQRLGGLACTWIEGDACLVDQLVSGPVDTVFIANTFHGVPDKPALARSVARILDPGGRFVIVNWHARPPEETTVLDQPRGPAADMRMTPEEVARVVVPAGFTLDEVVELPPWHYGAVFRLALPSREA